MNSPYIPVRTETCTFIVLKPFPPPTLFPPAKLPRFYAKILYGNNFPINRARYVNLIVNFTRVTSSLRVMHQPITLGRDNAFAICRAAGGMIQLESRNWESCPSPSKRQPVPKVTVSYRDKVSSIRWNELKRKIEEFDLGNSVSLSIRAQLSNYDRRIRFSLCIRSNDIVSRWRACYSFKHAVN